MAPAGYGYVRVEPSHTRTRHLQSCPSPVPIPVNGYNFFPYPSPDRVNGYPWIKILTLTTHQNDLKNMRGGEAIKNKGLIHINLPAIVRSKSVMFNLAT